jgi:hypothetical protein
MTTAIKGQALVEFVNEKTELVTRGELTRTQLIQEAGYLNTNGTAAYVDFYTELLKAKQEIDPNYVSQRDAEDAAYEALSGEEQDLYDSIDDKFGEKWTHEEVMEFMGELEDIGIETPEQLDEAYEYRSSEYYSEREFAEYYVTEVMCTGIPSVLEGHIDWDNVWSCELRYDFNTIEFDGDTYFFRNI